MWITDLTKEVKQQVELKTCSNKLWSYSFQNPEKSVSEILTIAKPFEVMKAYKKDVEKSGGHAVNTLNGTPRRSGKNGNLNRIGMSNNSKTCFRCGGVYSVAIYRATWCTFNPKLEILKKTTKTHPLKNSFYLYKNSFSYILGNETF